MKIPFPATALLLLFPFPPPLVAQQVSSFRIAVAEGESLHVVRAGVGQPVVLLPGLFGCAFGFRHLLMQLPARGNRVTVIEPLAIGSSSRPEGANYSLTAQADRIAAALRALESQRVVLVAHSVSASIALRLAVRHPELVRAVVVLDGGPMETVATKGFRQAMSYAPWVKWMGGMKRLRPYIRRDLVASSADSSWLTDAVLQAYTAGAAADLDGTLKAYLRMSAAREPEKLAPRLHEIVIPVRLVVGGAAHRGGISKDQIELLGARLPRFVIDSVPDAGHYLFEEAPSAVVAAIGRAQEASLAVGPAVSRP
ncbi:MAG: alpha/beta hydrolase [Gemmatimonadales bacterium]